jgi:hypothetical protein
MNTLSRPHHQWLRRWTAMLKRPLYRMFDEWYQTKEAGSHYTGATCPNCNTPAARPDAYFCFTCGMHLQGWQVDAEEIPTLTLSDPKLNAHHTDVTRTTGEIDISQIASQLAGLRKYPDRSIPEIRAIVLSHTTHGQRALPHSVRPARYTRKLAEEKEE